MTALDPSIQVATQGIFGIGLQAARGVPRTQNALFHYYPFTGIGYGFNQGMAALPPETGKSVTTRGAYKTGIDSQGQVSMIPRLIDTFGYLMLMLLGKDMVTPNTNIAGSAVSGCHLHTFTFDTASEVFLPYATTRRVVPGPRKLGELTQDTRMANAEINIPTVGPITWASGMLGRVPDGVDMFVNDPDVPWALNTITYESDDSFANAIDPASTVTIMGVDQRCTGLSISIQNELTPADQTRIVGAQTPYDYVVLSRAISVRATVLFTDKALYQALLAGTTPDATKWVSTPLAGDIDFRVFSPDTISGALPATQRAIQFRTTAGNIKWGVEGVLPLNPRQLMALNLVGTFVRNTSGNFFEARVQNGIATPYTQFKSRPYKYVSGATITDADSGTKTFTGTGLAGIREGDTVKISLMDDAGNNGTFTATADSDATTLVVKEAVVTASYQTGYAAGETTTKTCKVTAFTAPATVTGVGFSATGLAAGDTFVIQDGPIDPDNNGVYTVATINDTTITTVEQTIQTDAVLAPNGAVTSFTALTKTLVGTGFTGLKVGDTIEVSSSEDSANNGIYTVASVVSSTQITVNETCINTVSAPDSTAVWATRNATLTA